MTIGLAIILCIASLIIGIISGVLIGVSALCIVTAAGKADEKMGIK